MTDSVVQDEFFKAGIPDQLPHKEQKFQGFDFLRAIFSIVVVALHSNLFNLLSSRPGLSSISDILILNVGYVAVPVFIQISLFLFFINRKKFGFQYFSQKRCPKLISLYLFWTIAKSLFDSLFGNFEAARLGVSSFEKFIGFIISGGYTIFYFFFCLLFLTTIAELLIYLTNQVGETLAKRRIYYYFLFSCILVFSFSIIDLLCKCEVFTQIINYFNFLPYVFTAAIVVQEFDEGKLNKPNLSLNLKIVWLFILSLSFIILEWQVLKFFPDHSRLFPHYARISLVFISWFLLYLALLSTQKVPSIIRSISRYSLGIYGFHIFFIDRTNFLDSLSQVFPGLGILTKFLIALIGSTILTSLFKKSKQLKHFV
jgi:surface polysaccharide O-acyltransferase-like enzyme